MSDDSITEIVRQRDMYQRMALDGDEQLRSYAVQVGLLGAIIKITDHERAIALRKLAEISKELNRLIMKYEPPNPTDEEPVVRAISIMQKNGIR